jgi:uncharacterized protein YegL
MEKIVVQDLDFDIELANNQEQRLPCVLVLDTSYSMDGEPISELQSGLELFAHELKNDDDASQKVQMLVIKCGGNADIIGDWIDAENFIPPALEANGGTPLGQAVRLASDEIEARKETYRNNGISYLKPWLFIISDGVPTDNYKGDAADLVSKEKAGKFTTFPIAVEGADLSIMAEFAVRPPQKLQGTEFKKLFQWISASVRVGSQKADDSEKITLPSVDWAEV